MKTKVFNLIILDESGSMSCIELQALNGLNETLQTIRTAQDKFPEQEQLVSIVPFESGNIRLLRDKVSIKEVNDLRPEEYNPGAYTPLYDAIGFGINSIRKVVTDDDSVLVTIITDGEENSSEEYSGKAIAMIIDELKKKGWMFTYIGANHDAVSVAMTINITNAMNFVQDDEGTKAMFEKERRSRERYFEANALCCNMDHARARDARIAMACAKVKRLVSELNDALIAALNKQSLEIAREIFAEPDPDMESILEKLLGQSKRELEQYDQIVALRKEKRDSIRTFEMLESRMANEMCMPCASSAIFMEDAAPVQGNSIIRMFKELIGM